MSREEALAALDQVIHPEFKRSIIDLNMIRDLSVDDGHVSLTLILPFKESSIKDKLLFQVRQAIADRYPSVVVDIGLAEMSQRERARFLTAADGDITSGDRRGHCRIAPDHEQHDADSQQDAEDLAPLVVDPLQHSMQPVFH